MSQKTVKMIRKIFGPRAGYVLSVYNELGENDRKIATSQMKKYLATDNKEELLKQIIKVDVPLTGEEI